MNKETAIKVLKELHDKSLFAERTALETLIPELKESEDEKIRKEIISFIQDDINEINLKVSGDYDDRDKEDIAHQNWCKKVIAWLENIPYTIDHEKREGFHLGYKAALEKQETSYTKRDVDDAYLEGMAFAKDELEKQGEQEINEPDWCHHKVDLSDCSEEYRKAYYDGWNNCNQQHAQLKAEQKSVWSEEDEHRVKDTIYFLETAKKHYASTVELGACIDWLKSLKPQNRDIYNPYKEVVSSIAEMCDKYKSFSDDRANDFVNNVKVKCKDAKEYESLFPQNMWKPSDEQMDALNCARWNAPFNIEILDSLYNDLKKLIE